MFEIIHAMIFMVYENTQVMMRVGPAFFPPPRHVHVSESLASKTSACGTLYNTS